MKSNLLYRKTFGALCLLMYTISCDGTRFARGSGIYPQTFDVPVGAAVYCPANRTFYFGLGPTESASPEYGISSLAPDTTSTPLYVTPLATNENIQVPVGALALASYQGNAAPTIAGTGPLAATTSNYVFALAYPSSSAVSGALNDASGALNVDGLTTNGIVGLAANEHFIFAAVSPNGTGSVFGEDDSGIAVVRIDYNRLQTPLALSALIQTAAIEGDSGIKAQKLDPTVSEIFIQTQGTIAPATNMLYWDEPLKRLYAGLILTSGTNAGDGARSVVVGRVRPTGVLLYSPIAPDSAITANTSATQQEIVAGELSTAGIPFYLTTYKLSVMHASTGPSYLIVNGANGEPNTFGNAVGAKIFALPLVDLRQPDGIVPPPNYAIHGTLAAKNSALDNGKFVTPATVPGDLATDPTINALGNDAFALVGGSPLPLFAADNTTTINISDMVVVGDTVYVSIDITQSNTNETGILYSQAKFGPDGKIVGWTPWAKRAFPPYGLPSPMNPGAVLFFGVDAVSGNIIAVGDDDNQTVAVTEWDFGTRPFQLTTQLNRILTQGCYSVLDLDAFTREFDNATPQRYALFGGVNKVVFARISQTRDGNVSHAPQFVVENFIEPENILQTVIPQAGGPITVLEYARTSTNNYFFAGSQNGLFVFAGPNGTSFNVDTLSFLNQPPFTTGGWSKAPNINGSVIDIKTLGNALYVLTYSTSATQPMQNTLYSIPFAGTIDAMFAAPTIIAQTNVGIFSGIYSFSGMQLIGTSPDSSTDQIVLATNNGLFESSTVGGVATATSQATALWQSVPTSSSTFYPGIAGMDPSVNIQPPNNLITGTPSTVWPFSVQDQNNLMLFNRGGIQQLNGTTDAGPYAFVPTQFSGNSLPPTTTFPPITYFFSDGTRRFFVTKNTHVPIPGNSLLVSPYDTFAWNVVNPAQNVLSDPALTPCPTCNWVKQIGVSGILMAGTNTGVVALE